MWSESGTPQPPSAPSARDVARRLLAYESRDESDAAVRIAGAERLTVRVAEGLARSFGPYGAAALINRALARALTEHASLLGVSFTPAKPSSPAGLTGLADSVRTNDVNAIIEGMVAMLAALTEVIGRLVGDDLAMILLDQCTSAPTPPRGGTGAVHPTKTEP